MGVPDEKYGEAVGVFVVLSSSSSSDVSRQHHDDDGQQDQLKDELRTWVRGKLSNHLGMFSQSKCKRLEREESADTS